MPSADELRARARSGIVRRGDAEGVAGVLGILDAQQVDDTGSGRHEGAGGEGDADEEVREERREAAAEEEAAARMPEIDDKPAVSEPMAVLEEEPMAVLEEEPIPASSAEDGEVPPVRTAGAGSPRRRGSGGGVRRELPPAGRSRLIDALAPAVEQAPRTRISYHVPIATAHKLARLKSQVARELGRPVTNDELARAAFRLLPLEDPDAVMELLERWRDELDLSGGTRRFFAEVEPAMAEGIEDTILAIDELGVRTTRTQLWCLGLGLLVTG